MTLDEAIDDYEFKAEFYGDTANEYLADKYGRIAEWLRELRHVRMEIGIPSNGECEVRIEVDK